MAGGFRPMPVPHSPPYTPFPVTARQTGRADFPHPASSRPTIPSLSTDRRIAVGRNGNRGPYRPSSGLWQSPVLRRPVRPANQPQEGPGEIALHRTPPPAFPAGEGWFSLSFRLWRGLDVSAHRAVLLDTRSITGTVGLSLTWAGTGLLSSAGVTRPRRSYEPIRHLRSPVLALTGSPLVWRCRSTPRPQTSLVAHCSCPVRAATTTPVGSSAAYLARFAVDGGLPRCCGGSAPTLTLSRPARCSLALRPARSADPLTGPFLEVLQTICRLLIRPECFRLEREFAGLDFHQGEQCTLSRHT